MQYHVFYAFSLRLKHELWIYIAWTFNRFQSKLNWIETNEKFSPTTKKNMEEIAQIIAARLWDILCQLLCVLPRVLHICESLFSSSIEQFSFKCWFAVHLKWIQIKTRMYPILNGMRSSSFFHIRISFLKNNTVRGGSNQFFFKWHSSSGVCVVEII